MKTTGYGSEGRMAKMPGAWPAIMLLAFAFGFSPAWGQNTTNPSPPANAATNAATPAPSFAFFDGAAATLTPDGANAFNFDIVIKNGGTMKGDGSLKLLSDGEKKCDGADVAKPKAPITLEPNAIEIVRFEVTKIKLPATCYAELVTAGAGGSTALKQLKLSQQYVTSAVLKPLYICFGISMLVAFLTWVIAAARLGAVCLNFKLGSPAWDFAKSWTTNTTLAGAVISTALTLGALPELTQYASKTGYSALALLISLAVIVAPFIFIAFRIGVVGKDPKSETVVVYQGYLWAFLLSGAITLFAALAQLVVFFLLLDEVFLELRFWSFSPDRTPWSCNLGSALTFVLGSALCWYIGNTMYLTIDLQRGVNGDTDKRGDAARTRKAEIAKKPLLPWPVF